MEINLQKGVGDIMRSPLIETEARGLRDEARKEATVENARKTAIRMLKRGKLTIKEIAEDSELSIEEVKRLKAQLVTEPQTV